MFEGICERGRGENHRFCKGLRAFGFFQNLGGVTCPQSARIGFTWARKNQVRYHISESRMSSRCGQFCGHRPLSAGACREREAGKNRRRSRPLVYYKRLRREMQRFFESTRNENGFEAIRDEMIGSNSEWNPTILRCCARGRGKRLLWAGSANVGTHFVRCLLFAPRRRGGYLCPSWVLAARLPYWPSPQRQPVVLCFA